MNYNSYVESTMFKVKNPEEFKKEFHDRVIGDEVTLEVSEHGFKFYLTNPYIVDPGGDDTTEISEGLCVSDIVQKHIVDDISVHIRFHDENSHHADLCTRLLVLTSIASKWTNCTEILGDLERTIFPRYVNCLASCKNKETGSWIEKGNRYKALGEEIKRRRKYFIIEHKNGHQVTWGKEYFDDGGKSGT